MNFFFYLFVFFFIILFSFLIQLKVELLEEQFTRDSRPMDAASWTEEEAVHYLTHKRTEPYALYDNPTLKRIWWR